MTRTGRLRVFASGVLVLAVGAACGNILGIQDRSLDPGIADSSVGDAAHDGSLADSPAADGSVVDGPVADGSVDASATDALDAAVDTAVGVDSSAGDTGSDAPADATGDGSDGSVCVYPCPLVSGLNVPWIITNDGVNIYWTETGDNFSGAANGTVKGCPVSGCPASGPTTYAVAQPNPGVVVSDGTNLYWSNWGSPSGIMTCAVAGCSQNPTQIAPAGQPWGLAVDSAYIYWISEATNSLHRVPIDGGTNAFLWDGGGVSTTAQYIVMDDASVYVIDDVSQIFKVPAAGGPPTTLRTTDPSVNVSGDWNMLIDPAGLVFGDGQLGAVLQASTTVPDSGTTLVSLLHSPLGVATDPATGDVYWADIGTGSANDGTVGRVLPDGGGRSILASSLRNPAQLTIAGGYVYWLDRGRFDSVNGVFVPSTGILYRLPK